MDCRASVAEIVECARAGHAAGPELGAHLVACVPCRERWESQHKLSVHIRQGREKAASLSPSAARRDLILREFDRRHASIRSPLVWAAAIAALVIVGILALTRLNVSRPPGVAPSIAREGAVAEPSADENDFMPVPYALPLAPGEFVSVERTELQPAALARMGVPVDMEWGSAIPADVVVGQDGLPRAVRLVGALEF